MALVAVRQASCPQFNLLKPRLTEYGRRWYGYALTRVWSGGQPYSTLLHLYVYPWNSSWYAVNKVKRVVFRAEN